MVRTASNILWPFLAAAIAVCVAHCNAGCKPPNAAEAEAQYTAELLACVAKGNTCVEQGGSKAECSEGVKVCRRAVNEKWGLCPAVEWPYLNPCDEE